MGFLKTIGLSLFVLVIVAGCTQYNKPATTETPDESAMEGLTPDVVMEPDVPVTVQDSMEVDTSMETVASSYQDYSPKILKTELEAGNKVVLFFHAKWCPFLDKDKYCEIYPNLGEDYLSNVCYSFPRVYNILNGNYELSL